MKLFQETGKTSKKVYDKSDLPRKLTEFIQLFIPTASNIAARYTTQRSKLKFCIYSRLIPMNPLYIDSFMHRASLGKYAVNCQAER